MIIVLCAKLQDTCNFSHVCTIFNDFKYVSAQQMIEELYFCSIKRIGLKS